MKKLMCLGGNYFQMTAVKAAKNLGYYVIDVDYLPNNPAHKFADEYCNISTLDRDNVLQLAKEKQIDGIISYASDVSAPTAAYVAEQMGLQTNPYETIQLMTNKDLFHPFLRKNGFFVPAVATVNTVQDVYAFLEKYQDIILKPVNSSGSKGVSRITSASEVPSAFSYAKKYSSEHDKMVVEEFVNRKGYQVAGDAFIHEGKIVFFGIANEHFDSNCNPLVPIGESFPAKLSASDISRAKAEIQRAISLLNFKNGAINLDFMFDTNGHIFIIELGPRNGGNLITDAIQLSSGVNLAEYTAKSAVGDSIDDLKELPMTYYVSSYIWHSLNDGIYKGLEISNELQKKIVRSDLFIQPGDKVYRYKNAAFGVGAALLQFESQDEMIHMMDHMNEYYQLIVW